MSLSQLFLQLRSELVDILGESVVEDFRRVFLLKPGPYLRHALAHGLLSDFDPFGHNAIYGCWLMYRLCMIPLINSHDNVLTFLTSSNFFELAQC